MIVTPTVTNFYDMIPFGLNAGQLERIHSFCLSEAPGKKEEFEQVIYETIKFLQRQEIAPFYDMLIEAIEQEPMKGTGECFVPEISDKNKVRVLKAMLERHLEKHPDLARIQEKVSINEGFSEARQVLALYYLINSLGVDFASVDKSSLARFSRFLTNKETKGEIKNTGTYKRWIRMFTKSEKQAKKDLEFVKAQFQSIGLQKIVQEIQGDLDNAG